MRLELVASVHKGAVRLSIRAFGDVFSGEVSIDKARELARDIDKACDEAHLHLLTKALRDT